MPLLKDGLTNWVTLSRQWNEHLSSANFLELFSWLDVCVHLPRCPGRHRVALVRLAFRFLAVVLGVGLVFDERCVVAAGAASAQLRVERSSTRASIFRTGSSPRSGPMVRAM